MQQKPFPVDTPLSPWLWNGAFLEESFMQYEQGQSASVLQTGGERTCLPRGRETPTAV